MQPQNPLISPKTVVLDFDDFSILRSRMDLFKQLKEHVPRLKVSLFTIPYDFEYELSELRVERQRALEMIRQELDWMEIIPHGITHAGPEFQKADAQTMRDYLDNIEQEFAKDGLPIVKGFKAPHWEWNQEVVEVLNQYEWFGAVDRNQPNMLTPQRYYRYNLSIDEPFWLSPLPVWKLHGHMTPPSKNNINDYFIELVKYLPKDAEYKFVSEMVEEL